MVRCKQPSHAVLPIGIYAFTPFGVVYASRRYGLYQLAHSMGCDARFRHALTAEMSETFPSGGSMHASVKLEGIDGKAPQERVEHVA